MGKKLLITYKHNSFKKTIYIDGDKSISIRALLLGSQAYGKTLIENLLLSEDIINTINCLKKLGIRISLNKKICSIYGRGLNGFKYKKNIILEAGNSGTFARLILGLLIKSPHYIKVTGDKSLSRRDFERVILPLQKIGANFKVNKKKTLPLQIIGSNFINPTLYFENKGSGLHNDVDKKIRISEMADELKIARATLAEHLSRIECIVMDDLFGSFSNFTISGADYDIIRQMVESDIESMGFTENDTFTLLLQNMQTNMENEEHPIIDHLR